MFEMDSEDKEYKTQGARPKHKASMNSNQSIGSDQQEVKTSDGTSTEACSRDQTGLYILKSSSINGFSSVSDDNEIVRNDSGECTSPSYSFLRDIDAVSQHKTFSEREQILLTKWRESGLKLWKILHDREVKENKKLHRNVTSPSACRENGTDKPDNCMSSPCNLCIGQINALTEMNPDLVNDSKDCTRCKSLLASGGRWRGEGLKGGVVLASGVTECLHGGKNVSQKSEVLHPCTNPPIHDESVAENSVPQSAEPLPMYHKLCNNLKVCNKIDTSDVHGPDCMSDNITPDEERTIENVSPLIIDPENLELVKLYRENLLSTLDAKSPLFSSDSPGTDPEHGSSCDWADGSSDALLSENQKNTRTSLLPKKRSHVRHRTTEKLVSAARVTRSCDYHEAITLPTDSEGAESDTLSQENREQLPTTDKSSRTCHSVQGEYHCNRKSARCNDNCQSFDDSTGSSQSGDGGCYWGCGPGLFKLHYAIPYLSDKLKKRLVKRIENHDIKEADVSCLSSLEETDQRGRRGSNDINTRLTGMDKALGCDSQIDENNAVDLTNSGRLQAGVLSKTKEESVHQPLEIHIDSTALKDHNVHCQNLGVKILDHSRTGNCDNNDMFSHKCMLLNTNIPHSEQFSDKTGPMCNKSVHKHSTGNHKPLKKDCDNCISKVSSNSELPTCTEQGYCDQTEINCDYGDDTSDVCMSCRNSSQKMSLFSGSLLGTHTTLEDSPSFDICDNYQGSVHNMCINSGLKHTGVQYGEPHDGACENEPASIDETQYSSHNQTLQSHDNSSKVICDVPGRWDQKNAKHLSNRCESDVITEREGLNDSRFHQTLVNSDNSNVQQSCAGNEQEISNSAKFQYSQLEPTKVNSGCSKTHSLSGQMPNLNVSDIPQSKTKDDCVPPVLHYCDETDKDGGNFEIDSELSHCCVCHCQRSCTCKFLLDKYHSNSVQRFGNGLQYKIGDPVKGSNKGELISDKGDSCSEFKSSTTAQKSENKETVSDTCSTNDKGSLVYQARNAKTEGELNDLEKESPSFDLGFGSIVDRDINTTCQELSQNSLKGGEDLFPSLLSSGSVGSDREGVEEISGDWESGEADDEFECECDHCVFLRSHHTNHHGDLTEPLIDHEENLGFQGQENVEREHLDLWLPDAEDEEGLYQISVAELSPLSNLMNNRRNELELMFENVILQMLAVHPDLLSDQTPPPATEAVIDSLPEIQVAEEHLGQSCSICLCTYEENEKMSRLPCHHGFHQLCIKAWLVKSGTCPVCRQVL